MRVPDYPLAKLWRNSGTQRSIPAQVGELRRRRGQAGATAEYFGNDDAAVATREGLAIRLGDKQKTSWCFREMRTDGQELLAREDGTSRVVRFLGRRREPRRRRVSANLSLTE